MKKNILIILAIVLAFCLGFFFKVLITEKPNKSVKKTRNNNNVNIKKVTGIGGIFFKCKSPERLKEWYKFHLGFDTNQYGTSFEWQEGADSNRRGSIQWSPFSENDSYFNPSKKEFMINYKVENLDKLVKQLRKENVKILDTIETYAYGKFIHIMDIEGNKIELYEPNYKHGAEDK